MTLFQLFAVLLAIGGIAPTLLTLVPSGNPIFRIWDFPRAQIATFLRLGLVTIPLAFSHWSAGVLVLAALTFVCLGWQARAIVPYTALARAEVSSVESADNQNPAFVIRLLAANVLKSNRDATPLRRLIEARRPDIILLLEGDHWWDEHLLFLRKSHPHFIASPQENRYGMHLFSRFKLVDAEVRFLVRDQVPSFKVSVRACIDFKLYCVHPQPPPVVHTQERDAELLMVGKEVRNEGAAAVVAGDLNDVAWSRSTRLFQKVSGLLDPRKGRGMYNTFSAKLPFFLRWPLDHVFFSEHFHLMEIEVLGDIGSDHFPLFVQLMCLGQASGATPAPDRESIREADMTIKEGERQGSDDAAGHGIASTI